MSKYDPLKTFLAAQPGDRIPMTFSEIESALGFALPASKQYPAWWSNSPDNNTMTQAWLGAGFKTEQVDIPRERLVFRRVALAGVADASAPFVPTPARAGRHPAFGCMKGLIKVADGVDLTAPTGEVWDAEIQ